MERLTVKARDGVRLAVRRVGDGPTVLLLHGLFSNAETNWCKFGHADRLANAGFCVVMPDLRAHGNSEAPRDADRYPANVLVDDLQDCIGALGLDDYVLGGFSLGARTALHGVVAGLRPRRLILAGMGLEGLRDWTRRSAFFLDAIDRFDEIRMGDPAFFAVSFMKTMKVDRIAMRHLIESVRDIATDELAAATMPTLLVCGDKDNDNGSAAALAAALPAARLDVIPGTHMSSVAESALGEAMVRFLTA